MAFSRFDTLWQKPTVYWPLLIILAAATPFTFAPYYNFWLMPLIFGAFIRLLELRPERQTLSAYLFGLIAYVCQFYWIHTALHDISGLPNIYAIPLTFLLPAYLALFPMLAVWLWQKTRLSRPLKTGIALPVYWTLTEFARERLLTGFGWGALGYSQIADFSPLAGFAPLGGIHLVTLATAFAGAWLALIIDNPGQTKQRIISAAALASLLLTGGLLRQIEFTQPDGSKATVALPQGNIPQTLKWDEAQVLPTIQRYLDMVSATRADIVILPETALTVMRQQLPPEILGYFSEQSKANGSALAIGIAQFTDNGTNYENAVINMSAYDPAKPDDLPYYAKNHLVPFGEYKPLPAITEPLYQMMNMPLADFKRGGNNQQPLIMGNQKIAFNICYEDGFGDKLIAPAKQASLLANASNLAWYGKSNAMYQHLQQSQARSLELGRYMVRATNTGATAIVDPKGRITLSAPADTVTTLEGEIQGYSGETPYMKLGSSWPLISLLTLSAAILFGLGYKRRS
ncbi:apolipoprotein N-acyltransferase [Neisseria sp. 83E34]|uniref:apolipoprotein N-acyltransferase n=1 Tax=Neisseria sp. 83E34 TaxID=1692264 RepID=UPI0006CE8529|nr:apolipoprotein N-acyltransferase [Neisseria sp. 83E34]KPN72514.1 acyltransferase [Neisseria sp. 83E34]